MGQYIKALPEREREREREHTHMQKADITQGNRGITQRSKKSVALHMI